DLSGNGHDATQASNATRPTFVFSCQNAKPCMTMNGSQFLSIAALGNVSQPWTVIGVGQRTSGGFSNLFGDGSGTGYGILYNSGVNAVATWAGTVLSATASDGAF